MKIVDLVKYDLLVREKNNPSRRILDYQLAIKGVKIRAPKMESVSNNVILSMVMNNFGIGIIPKAVAKKYIENKEVISVTRLN